MRMEKVYITNDGKSHKSVDDALSHVNNEYGKVLTKLAHRCCQESKYIGMADLLHTSLHDMQLLIDLDRESAQIENWDEDSENTDDEF